MNISDENDNDDNNNENTNNNSTSIDSSNAATVLSITQYHAAITQLESNDDLNKNHTNADEADDGTDDDADDGFHFSDVIFCLLIHIDPMII